MCVQFCQDTAAWRTPLLYLWLQSSDTHDDCQTFNRVPAERKMKTSVVLSWCNLRDTVFHWNSQIWFTVSFLFLFHWWIFLLVNRKQTHIVSMKSQVGEEYCCPSASPNLLVPSVRIAGWTTSMFPNMSLAKTIYANLRAERKGDALLGAR